MWIINEQELFSVNPKPKIQTQKVGSRKIVIVDDFYKNPDKVRDFIMRSPATTWKEVVQDYPAARHSIACNLETVHQVLKQIIEDEYDLKYLQDPIGNFRTNIYKQNEFPAGMCAAPHSDHFAMAAIVYFNTDKECFGGTSFYKHKKTGLEVNPTNSFHRNKEMQNLMAVMKEHGLKTMQDLYDLLFKNMANLKDFITQSNKEWELTGVVKMKYNRLAIYEGHIFHSAFIKKSWFKDYYRINQALFYNSLSSL